jgi:hypothetical protein
MMFLLFEVPGSTRAFMPIGGYKTFYPESVLSPTEAESFTARSLIKFLFGLLSS